MEVQTRNYSDIDSLEKAQALFHAGKLERTFLFPLEFGGQEIPQNTLYVPLGIAAVKKRIDSMIQDQGASSKGKSSLSFSRVSRSQYELF